MHHASLGGIGKISPVLGLTLKNAHAPLARSLTLSVSLAVTLNSLALVGFAQSILPPVQDVTTAPVLLASPQSNPTSSPTSSVSTLNTASSNETEALSQLEVRVLGASSPQLPLTQRIEQLERVVFGEAQTGTLSARETQLLKMIQSPSAAGDSAATPASADDMARQMQDGFRPYQSAPPATQIPEAENVLCRSRQPRTGQRNRRDTDYPTVTALEQQVFRQSYVSDDITQRLNRLEQQVFGRPNQAMALVDRVDRLVTQVPVVASQPARVYPDATTMYERPARAPVQSRPAPIARAPVKPSPLG
jgi:hypothetical protein